MIIPDLQSSLICDDVRQEVNGKFILIGLFDSLAVSCYPVKLPKFCIVNRWCSGQGKFYQKTRIIKPDGINILVEGKDVPLELSDPEVTATSVEFFLNVKFETEGTYWIEILLNGDLKLRYPLKARIINIVETRGN